MNINRDMEQNQVEINQNKYDRLSGSKYAPYLNLTDMGNGAFQATIRSDADHKALTRLFLGEDEGNEDVAGAGEQEASDAAAIASAPDVLADELDEKSSDDVKNTPTLQLDKAIPTLDIPERVIGEDEPENGIGISSNFPPVGRHANPKKTRRRSIGDDEVGLGDDEIELGMEGPTKYEKQLARYQQEKEMADRSQSTRDDERGMQMRNEYEQAKNPYKENTEEWPRIPAWSGPINTDPAEGTGMVEQASRRIIGGNSAMA